MPCSAFCVLLNDVAIASCGVHGRREGLVKADGQRARQSTRTMLLDAGDVLRWLHEMQGEGVRATKNTVQGISSLLPVLGASGGVSGPQAREEARVRAAGHVPFLLDPLVSAERLPNRDKKNVFGTCSRKIGYES